MFEAIGYIRFPKGSNGSPAMAIHRELLQAQCEQHHMGLLRVVEENGVPDSTPVPSRSGLLKVIEAIGAGEAQVLAVGDPHQLAASKSEFEAVVTRLQDADGHLCIGGELVF